MKNANKIYITAAELSDLLGVSSSHAYKWVRLLNKELEKNGFITVAGKIPRKYFNERYYGGCTTDLSAVGERGR